MTDEISRVLSFGEAPASVNFRITTGKGLDVQFTLRDADEANLLHRMSAFIGKLEEKGVLKKQETTAPAPQQTVSQPLQATPQSVSHNTPSSGLTFECATMEAEVKAGKPHWKIKGGKWAKFGVTVWPEVLEQAGFPTLDPNTVYNLAGYTAHCQPHPDDPNKPSKVVQLVHH